MFNISFADHLKTNFDFVNTLKEAFKPNEIDQIIKYLNGNDNAEGGVIDDFLNWFDDEMSMADNSILAIGWSSKGWEPGGGGYFRYIIRFGLVQMKSSDYDDDRIQIFDKESFFPWGFEALDNDIVELSSDVFSEFELLDMSHSMGLRDDTELYINDNIVNR